MMKRFDGSKNKNNGKKTTPVFAQNAERFVNLEKDPIKKFQTIYVVAIYRGTTVQKTQLFKSQLIQERDRGNNHQRQASLHLTSYNVMRIFHQFYVVF